MKIDNETGNITYVDVETHEAMKEEYKDEIEELKQENEDLKDRIAEFEEHFEYVNKLLNSKKDSVAATNESKIN